MKRQRLFFYKPPRAGLAYGPVAAESEAKARSKLRELWEVGSLRGWAVWETTREEMLALEKERRRDPLLYRE